MGVGGFLGKIGICQVIRTLPPATGGGGGVKFCFAGGRARAWAHVRVRLGARRVLFLRANARAGFFSKLLRRFTALPNRGKGGTETGLRRRLSPLFSAYAYVCINILFD